MGVNRIGVDGQGINHSGDSVIVGPSGEILYDCADRKELHTQTLDPVLLQETRDRFPFLRDADGFMILSDELPE